MKDSNDLCRSERLRVLSGKLRRINGVLLCLVWLYPSLVQGGTDFTAQVIVIIDGDSIHVLHNRQSEQVRLAGIDCLERKNKSTLICHAAHI